MNLAAPLLLTLRFDAESFQTIDGWRRRYFPSERNVIPAHLSLFHRLPGEHEATILEQTRAVCATAAPGNLPVMGVRFLGRGFALEVEAGALKGLRSRLAQAWETWLTAQDREPWRPHITLQNKVSPGQARRDFEIFRASFAPFALRTTGVLVWRYLGGPWAEVAAFGFGE